MTKIICSDCGGYGRNDDYKCWSCSGSGYIESTVAVPVKDHTATMLYIFLALCALALLAGYVADNWSVLQ